jgi:hypothetical protein
MSLARTASRKLLPTMASASSPARWPAASLIAFMLSTSTSKSDTGWRDRYAARSSRSIHCSKNRRK